MKANSLALALITPPEAFAEEKRDTFLWDEFGIDQDETDQGQMYYEDDPVHDEANDYDRYGEEEKAKK